MGLENKIENFISVDFFSDESSESKMQKKNICRHLPTKIFLLTGECKCAFSHAV